MDDCLFCKISSGEIPSKKVYENDLIYAFEDVSPQAPVHILIVPKKHFSNINEVSDEKILSALFKAVKEITKEKDLDKKGFRIVINTGEDGGQSVDHLHLHLLAGRNLKWPPG